MNELDGIDAALAVSLVTYFKAGGHKETVMKFHDIRDSVCIIRKRFPDEYMKMVAAGWFE